MKDDLDGKRQDWLNPYMKDKLMMFDHRWLLMIGIKNKGSVTMYDLERFVKAQRYDYAVALSEMRRGHKESHWIWYIFPQLKELGYSSNAKYYGIEDLDEAKAYLAHPLLSARLQEICEATLEIWSNDPEEVFGYPDNFKFNSCMTLFEQADPSNPIYAKLIDKFYQGKRDHKTLNILHKKS